MPLLAAAGGDQPAARSLIGRGAGAAMLAEAAPSVPWLRPPSPFAQRPASSPRPGLGAERRRRPAGWRKVG